MKIYKIFSESKSKEGFCGEYSKPKPGQHLDTQLFPECKGKPGDRDVVRKHNRRKNKSKKKASKEIDDDLIKFVDEYWKPVNSSFIDAIAYVPDFEILELRFKNGKQYIFRDVSEFEYELLMNSDSKGVAFSEFRKRRKTLPF